MPGSDIAWNSFKAAIKDNTALVFDHSIAFHANANQLGSLQCIVAGRLVRGAYVTSLLYKKPSGPLTCPPIPPSPLSIKGLLKGPYIFSSPP